MLESCPTQASLFPEGEKETQWTQPPGRAADKLSRCTMGSSVSSHLLHWRTQPCRHQRSSSCPSMSIPACPLSPSHTQRTLWNNGRRYLIQLSTNLVHNFTRWYSFGSTVEAIPGLEVAGANCNEVVVGMPVNAEHSGAQWLLDVLTHPPGRQSMCVRQKGHHCNRWPLGQMNDTPSYQSFSFSK